MAGGLAGQNTVALGIRTRSDRLRRLGEGDRSSWMVLAAAMLCSAALILFLNRGTTFYVDELAWLYDTPDLGVGGVFEPYGGHLLAPTRLAYAAILHTIGPEYLAVRILGVIALLLCAGLLFELMRRRVGAAPALAPALLLLVFGSAWEYVAIPIGFSTLLSIATGLAALLALEREERAGDVSACVLLTLSVVSFGTGLAFLVGVAVAVLLHPDRPRRAWVFLSPLVLYATWWLAARSMGDPGDQVMLSNVLQLPRYAFEALAATLTALTGLNADVFAGEPLKNTLPIKWGGLLVVPAVAALLLRIRAGNVPRSLWASIAILLTVWILGALVLNPVRPPNSARYVFMGTVVTLLVATDALRGKRFPKVGVLALFVACGISAATNFALLRDGAAKFRSYSAFVRADLAMAELAREQVDPQFNPLQNVSELFLMNEPVVSYFEVVDRYGSPAFSFEELKRQSEAVQASADQILVRAYQVRPRDGSAKLPLGQCERFTAPARGEAVEVALPSGGVALRALGATRPRVFLGRFAQHPSVEVAKFADARRVILPLPPDQSSQPWRARIVGARSVKVCARR